MTDEQAALVERIERYRPRVTITDEVYGPKPWCIPHLVVADMIATMQAQAATITALQARVEEQNETIIAFAGPWAEQYAHEHGMPDRHLHPTHYDILDKAGARMDGFARATLGDVT